MKQWLMIQKFTALNTMYRKTTGQQATYRTPEGTEKQLDYILVTGKIHMGSDHRSDTILSLSKHQRKKSHKNHTATRCR